MVKKSYREAYNKKNMPSMAFTGGLPTNIFVSEIKPNVCSKTN